MSKSQIPPDKFDAGMEWVKAEAQVAHAEQDVRMCNELLADLRQTLDSEKAENDRTYRQLEKAMIEAADLRGRLGQLREALRRWDKYASYVVEREVVAPLWDNVLFGNALAATRAAFACQDTPKGEE